MSMAVEVLYLRPKTVLVISFVSGAMVPYRKDYPQFRIVLELLLSIKLRMHNIMYSFSSAQKYNSKTDIDFRLRVSGKISEFLNLTVDGTSTVVLRRYSTSTA
jgi:hypothetical protein